MKLRSNVIHIFGHNPRPYTLLGTNTFLIGTGRRRALLDTGEYGVSKFTKELLATLNREEAEIEKIVLTHSHPDHIGGLPDVLNAIRAIQDYVPSVHKYMDGNTFEA